MAQMMEQAQKALKFCVNSLNKNDRFGLIKFGSEVTAFEDKLLPAGKDNIKDAREWVDEIVAVGTPEGVDGEADLKYVGQAAKTIAQTMK